MPQEMPGHLPTPLRVYGAISRKCAVKTLRAISAGDARDNAGMNTTPHSTNDERLVLTAAEAAQLLGISVRHFWSLLASGRIGPQPLAFGRTRRWRRAELVEWIAAGAPSRDQWRSVGIPPEAPTGGHRG